MNLDIGCSVNHHTMRDDQGLLFITIPILQELNKGMTL